MAKKMFVVRVELDMVVMAEDERDAEITAQENVQEEVGNGMADFVAYEVAVSTDVPPYWMNCLPWGGDDEKTVEQILNEGAVDV